MTVLAADGPVVAQAPGLVTRGDPSSRPTGWSTFLPTGRGVVLLGSVAHDLVLLERDPVTLVKLLEPGEPPAVGIEC